MKKLVLIFSLVFAIDAKAVGVCDNSTTLSNLWQTKYSSIIQISAPDFTVGTPTYKIAQALCFLENPGIPNFVNFFNYIALYVKNTIFPSGGDDRWAAVDYNRLGTLKIYDSYFEDRKGMEYIRASTLIHEARHIELEQRGVSNHKHVICNHGESEGLRGCDQSFTDDRWENASPIAYEIMFLRNIYDKSQYNINRPALKYWVNLLLDNYINDVSAEIYNAYKID